jgi:hypothetical protein
LTGDRNRIRIAVGGRELELEGDETFLAAHKETLDVLLAAVRAERSGRVSGGGGEVSGSAPALSGAEFGEQLGALPRSATATDQVLLAGRFAQLASEDNAFATKDANALLLEQSIKVGNPSQCMANNLAAKRVFKVGGKYRVSRAGEEHLASLLNS